LIREIRDIESVDPKSGEEQALAERRQLLRSAGRITDKLSEAYEALYGSDSGDGAISLIIDAENASESAARLAEPLQELASALSDLRYRAEDAADRLRAALDELDFEPGELDRTENRLSSLERLSRRYGDAEGAQRRLEQARNELEDVMYLTENIERTEAELKALKEETLLKARELSSERKKAGEKLAKRIEEELRQLSMPSARFSVEMEPKSGESFDSTGMDEVRFLLSANAGEELGRLSRIASGGELSRIMLGMKNVLSSDNDAEVLIFDEVDAGVSGVAAQRVAEKLWSLSAKRQILCVTHLPQIAAMADAHFSIEKKESGGRTFTTVTLLDGEGRKRELARLTAGETVTQTTLLGAGELISSANKYKEGTGK
ncbi:MAG: DNA repair protein RecN, partial [Oscillospiraceae bacterium]|nr:DNA repair protein RecN [Oscillospiraceae bacterium]